MDVEVAVKFAKEELEGAGCEEVGGTVPTDIVEGLELVGNVRDGGGDDGVVEGNAEDGYARGQVDDEELGISGGLGGLLQLDGLKRL